MKKGERYTIRNNTMSGKEIVEGIATLVEFVPSDVLSDVPSDIADAEVWMVKFDEDIVSTFSRVVRPEDKESEK